MVIFLELKYTVAPFYGRTHGYLEGNLTGRSCLSNKTTAITTRTYGLPSFKPTELISGEGGHTSFGKATPPKPLKQHHQVEIRCSKARAFGGLISLQVYMGTLTLVYMYHRYNRETKRKKKKASVTLLGSFTLNCIFVIMSLIFYTAPHYLDKTATF